MSHSSLSIFELLFFCIAQAWQKFVNFISPFKKLMPNFVYSLNFMFMLLKDPYYDNYKVYSVLSLIFNLSVSLYFGNSFFFSHHSKIYLKFGSAL